MVNDKIVDRALELVAEGGGNYEYFFSQLKSPDWIAPLSEQGEVFPIPPMQYPKPAPFVFLTGQRGTTSFEWPIRPPEQVFNALTTKVYESSNYIVHQILLEIAINLPVGVLTRDREIGESLGL